MAKCRGDTLEELFESASCALYDYMLASKPIPASARNIRITDASSLDDLLIRWLQEILFLFESEHFAMTNCTFDIHPPDSLAACLQGGQVSEDAVMAEIKAATYHQLDVQHTPEGWVAQIVFDL